MAKKKRKEKSPNSFINEIHWVVKQRNFWRLDKPWWWNSFSVRSKRCDAVEAFCEHNRMTIDEYEEKRRQSLVACKKVLMVEQP